jgi:drug/metabolite transporter, DME family
MSVRSPRLSVLSVLAATSLWGTSGPAQALAHTGANPAAVGAARLLLGGLALAAVALASGAPPRAWLCGRDWYWLAVAAVSTGVFQAAFFAAVDRTGAALATLVALGAAPVATGLSARWLQGEPLTMGWVGATATATAGCALLLLPGDKTAVDAVGVALALVSAGCYGGYTVAAKRLLQTDRPVEGLIAASLLGGGLLLAPAFAGHASGLVSAHGILLTAWLGLISTALAYVLFVRGLRRVRASTAGTLSLAEPLVAVALAVLVLGERLAPLTIVGASLLLAGIAAASLPSLRRPAPVDALVETPG